MTQKSTNLVMGVMCCIVWIMLCAHMYIDHMTDEVWIGWAQAVGDNLKALNTLGKTLIEDVERQQDELVALQREHAEKRQTWYDAAYDKMCHDEIQNILYDEWHTSTKPITYGMLKRLVWIESRCLPWADNGQDGDLGRGLAGVTPTVGQLFEVEVEDLFNPHINVRVALSYMERLKQRSEDPRVIVRMYHWGPTRIDAGGTYNTEYEDAVLGTSEITLKN